MKHEVQGTVRGTAGARAEEWKTAGTVTEIGTALGRGSADRRPTD